MLPLNTDTTVIQIVMKENRDFWWSEFFTKASIACDVEAVDEGSTALLLPTR